MVLFHGQDTFDTSVTSLVINLCGQPELLLGVRRVATREIVTRIDVLVHHDHQVEWIDFLGGTSIRVTRLSGGTTIITVQRRTNVSNSLVSTIKGLQTEVLVLLIELFLKFLLINRVGIALKMILDHFIRVGKILFNFVSADLVLLLHHDLLLRIVKVFVWRFALLVGCLLSARFLTGLLRQWHL
jgi:hypothetical protein